MRVDARKTPGIAIWGVVLSLVPVFLVNFAGAALGIVALRKIQTEPGLYKGRALAVVAIVIGFGWIFVGIGGVVAVPAFTRLTGGAKQVEARRTLEALAVAEKAHFGEHGVYCGTFAELGRLPRSAHYTYFLAEDVAKPARAAATALVGESFAHADGFRIVAVANLDADDTLDVWAVDAGGVPVHVHDDVRD